MNNITYYFIYFQSFIETYLQSIELINKIPPSLKIIFSLSTVPIMIMLTPISQTYQIILFGVYLYMLTTNVIISGFKYIPKYIPMFELSKGRSMFPTVSAGYTFILVSSNKDYKKGDVVSYINEDGVKITHRIINVYNNKYEIKGDFHFDSDGIYNKEDIVYKHVSINGQCVYIPISILSIIETVFFVIPNLIKKRLL